MSPQRSNVTCGAAPATPSESTGPTRLSHRREFSSDGPVLIRHMSNDLPELRGVMRRTMTTTDASTEVVVFVDPYSSGCCVAQETQKRGYSIIALYTREFSEEMKKHVPLSCEGLTYLAAVDEGHGLEETAHRLRDAAGTKRVVAVIAGGEAGVDTADALSEYMVLRSNGTDVPNRRDKKIQQELISDAGLRSVRQAGGSKFEDVEEFLTTEEYPLVLKPTESAGSDGVKLCHSFEEAKEHFHALLRLQMVNGGMCGAVLCQEFLRGKEYVVDHVSRDGVHKTMMVWVYDKRPANGSQFVYYSCTPVDPQSQEALQLIPYIHRVLDVLGVRNGPSHGEVIITSSGPCLVEMNCRANGGDGNWRPLCLALTGGYSQIEASVDSYLDKRAFLALPDVPPSPLKASGHETFLVSYSQGTVKSTPGFEIIKNLPSFVYLETGVKPGSKVVPTIDFVTCVGSVILYHEDHLVVERDLDIIREMEKRNGLFEYEEDIVPIKAVDKLKLSETLRERKAVSSSLPSQVFENY